MTSFKASLQLHANLVEIFYEDAALEKALSYLLEQARQPFSVRRTLTYKVRGFGPYEVYEEGDLHCEVASPLDVQHVVYGRIYRRVVERYVLTGWVAFHAALATIGGSRTLILGHKGTGKTTLATQLLYSGYRVEADEMVLVREGQALPMPRAFHLKPGIDRQVPEVAEMVGDLPKAYAGDLEISAFDPIAAGFDWEISLGPLDRVVWITPNHGGETRIEHHPSFLAMQQVLECSLGWGEERSTLVAEASGVVSRGGYELLLGDAREAVPLLQAI